MQLRPVTLFAGAVCTVATLCLFGAGYLAFVFPRTVMTWADLGATLTATQQFAADLCHFVKVYGLFLLPALLAAVMASAIWFARSLSDPGDD